MKKIQFVFALLLLISAAPAFAQEASYIDLLNRPNPWVDSVFKTLNRREKVAQLLLVRAYSNKGKAFEDSIAQVIQDQKIGGLVFFQGGPVRQAQLSNRYQQLSEVPLLIAIDAEWGAGMRLDSTVSYPYQMALGAIQDNSLIYKMGQNVAYDLRRMGIQMNFAPDMDINNNPANPVINYRSFGDNKLKVAAKGITYMQGMQSGRVLTTAKHFPGHGDTNVDSHQDLPQLPFTRERLDTLEEYPFKEAIRAGISGIMVAHMNIPALDTTKNLPSTLSQPIITGLLKNTLGFKGLVVSDAMDMKGVVKFFPEGQADVLAFVAGNDMLELSQDSKRAIKLMRKAVRKGQVSKEELDLRVKKVLTAKYWAGLNQYRPADINNLIADLNRPAAATLVQQLSDASVTLLKGDTLIRNLNPAKKTAIISVGIRTPTVFQQELKKTYANSTYFLVDKDITTNELNQMLAGLSSYDQIIIGIHDIRTRPASQLNYTNLVKQFIAEVATRKNTVISMFANPYAITGLPGIEKAGAILECYQKDDSMQRSAVKVITGQLKPTGKLSVTVNEQFKNGTGL
jgi:beta-N-acetylhexosaminidase